jgi:NADPH2:quinone reductase
MYAMTVDHNRSLNWTEVPDPAMGSEEVLVRIHATALNRADLLQRRGMYPPPPGAPEWMGLEIAGVVDQVGEDAARRSHWRPGDRVCALLAGGGYAEKVVVRPEVLLPVPKGLSMEEAASLPEVFATSYLNLFMEAELKAGESILIHAGASGVGIAAIQLAKAFGVRVLTTVGSIEKAEAIRSLRPDIIIERTFADVGAVLDQEAVEGRPVNVVLDCVGGTELGEHMVKLARGGRWILIGTLGGDQTQISLWPLLTRGLKLIGSTLRSRPLEAKAHIIREMTNSVWPKIETGEIRPVVYRVLPISRAEEAHEILERRENVGKVVLTIQS